MDDKELVALFRCVHFWHVGAEVMTLSAAEVGMVIRFALCKTWRTLIKTLLPQSNGHWMRFTRFKKPPAVDNRSSNPGGQYLFFAHLRCHLSLLWSHFSNCDDNRGWVHQSHSTGKLSKDLSMLTRFLSLELSRTQSSLPCFLRGCCLTSLPSFSTKTDALLPRFLTLFQRPRRKGSVGAKKRTWTVLFSIYPNGRRVPLRNTHSKVA